MKRSPLRQQPLRDPGQSLAERIDDLAFNKVAFWLILPSICWLLAFLEWWRWYFTSPPAPLFSAIAAALVTGANRGPP